MNPLIIIGTGGHSRAVADIAISSALYSFIALIDLKGNDSESSETILGIPVLEYQRLADYDPQSTNIFVAVGDNEKRAQINMEFFRKGYTLPNLIHPSAIISEFSAFGYGNFVGPLSYIGPKTDIGNGNIINTCAIVEHETSLENHSQLSPGVTVCGRCKIESKVFVGANATILDNLRIAKRSIIGAGAVIIKSITEPGDTYVGIPGRKL